MEKILIVKIISALVYPVSLVSIFLLLSAVLRLRRSKKLSRVCFITGVGILVISSNPQVASNLVHSLEKQHPQRPMYDIQKHDAIIVLGGGLRLPTAPAQHTQLSSASDRYWYAVQLYRAGKAKKIIISGGNVIDNPKVKGEAFYANQLLQSWGVPSDAIIFEAKSRNTRENKQAVLRLVSQNDIRSALLVTSALHMPRSFALFRQLPISITTASSDVLVRDAPSIEGLNWIPSASALQLTTAAMHECYAIIYGRLKALISNS